MQHAGGRGLLVPGRRARRTRPSSRRHRQARSVEHRGQRRHPGRAVDVGGVLGGRVRDAGRVADEQHRRGHPGGGEHARRRGRPRSAASVRHRRVATIRSRRAGSNTVTGETRLRRSALTVVPSRLGPLARPAAGSPSTSSSSVDCSAARASSQAVTAAGDGVGGVRLHLHPTDGGVRAGAAGPPCSRPAPCTRRSASGRGGRPSGWCRRGWPRR